MEVPQQTCSFDMASVVAKCWMGGFDETMEMKSVRVRCRAFWHLLEASAFAGLFIDVSVASLWCCIDAVNSTLKVIPYWMWPSGHPFNDWAAWAFSSARHDRIISFTLTISAETWRCTTVWSVRESMYSSVLDGVLLVIVLVCKTLVFAHVQNHKENPRTKATNRL